MAHPAESAQMVPSCMNLSERQINAACRLQQPRKLRCAIRGLGRPVCSAHCRDQQLMAAVHLVPNGSGAALCASTRPHGPSPRLTTLVRRFAIVATTVVRVADSDPAVGARRCHV